MPDEILCPQRLPQPAQVLEDPPPIGRFEHPPLLFLRHARDHQALERAGLLHRGDRTVARTRERERAVHNLLQDGVHVEGLVHAEDGLCQSYYPDPQGFVLRLQTLAFRQCTTSHRQGSVPGVYHPPTGGPPPCTEAPACTVAVASDSV